MTHVIPPRQAGPRDARTPLQGREAYKAKTGAMPTGRGRAMVLFGIAVAALVWVPSAAGAGEASAQSKNSTSAHQCQDRGWRTLVTETGQPFANAGQCTSYATHGGTLTVNPYPGAKVLCESYGGAFGVGGPAYTVHPPSLRVLWVCNGWSVVPDLGFQQQVRLLSQRCTANGGNVLYNTLETNFATCGEGVV